MVDREVDQPGQALEGRDVGEATVPNDAEAEPATDGKTSAYPESVVSTDDVDG